MTVAKPTVKGQSKAADCGRKFSTVRKIAQHENGVSVYNLKRLSAVPFPEASSPITYTPKAPKNCGGGGWYSLAVSFVEREWWAR